MRNFTATISYKEYLRTIPKETESQFLNMKEIVEKNPHCYVRNQFEYYSQTYPVTVKADSTEDAVIQLGKLKPNFVLLELKQS